MNHLPEIIITAALVLWFTGLWKSMAKAPPARKTNLVQIQPGVWINPDHVTYVMLLDEDDVPGGLCYWLSCDPGDEPGNRVIKPEDVARFCEATGFEMPKTP
jgi:hypothetical protein